MRESDDFVMEPPSLHQGDPQNRYPSRNFLGAAVIVYSPISYVRCKDAVGGKRWKQMQFVNMNAEDIQKKLEKQTHQKKLISSSSDKSRWDCIKATCFVYSALPRDWLPASKQPIEHDQLDTFSYGFWRPFNLTMSLIDRWLSSLLVSL